MGEPIDRSDDPDNMVLVPLGRWSCRGRAGGCLDGLAFVVPSLIIKTPILNPH